MKGEYMETYIWKFKGLYKPSAEDVMAELNEISTEEITPQAVVEHAKSEDSCMHCIFEWDDEIAGEKYRLQQAAQMLRSIKVVHLDENEEPQHEPFRQFQVNSTRTHTYVPTKIIVQNMDEYQKLLERAKGELIAFENRYKTLVELDGVFDSIHELIAS